MVTTHSESEWRLLRSLRNQGRADSRRLARARAARLQLPDRRHPRGDRPRAAREARRDPRGAARRSRRGTRSCSRTSPGLELPCADDADHERSWFVYVVTLPRRRRPRGGDRGARRERGVQTARYLPCIHLQPYMQERFGYRVGLCPVAEESRRARSRCRSTRASPRTTRRTSRTRSANLWSSAARDPALGEPRSGSSSSRSPCSPRSCCSARTGARHTPPHDAGADGLPRLREVRPRGQDLRARADHRRRPWRRTADARLGRRRRASRSSPREPSGRSSTTWATRRGDSALLDGALDLAERLAAAAEEGRVDLGDLGRRARKLLAATARPAETEPLF